jgi:translation initiation factor 1
MKHAKLPTGGGEDLGHNPFASLNAAGLPSVPTPNSRARPPGALDERKSPDKGTGSNNAPGDRAQPEKNRGRVDIIRETGNRAGKTVTVVTNFTGIGLPEKESLAKQMRAACGCGGTVKDGRIEIQGDQRETVAKILREAGFRPVFAGG